MLICYLNEKSFKDCINSFLFFSLNSTQVSSKTSDFSEIKISKFLENQYTVFLIASMLYMLFCKVTTTKQMKMKNVKNAKNEKNVTSVMSVMSENNQNYLRHC